MSFAIECRLWFTNKRYQFEFVITAISMFNNSTAIEANNSQIKLTQFLSQRYHVCLHQNCLSIQRCYNIRRVNLSKLHIALAIFQLHVNVLPYKLFEIDLFRAKKSMLNYSICRWSHWALCQHRKMSNRALALHTITECWMYTHFYWLHAIFFNVSMFALCFVGIGSEKNSFILIPFSVCDYIIRIASASARSRVQQCRRIQDRLSIALLHCQCQFCDTVLASMVRLCSWNILNSLCHWTTRTLTNLEFPFSRNSWHVINIVFIYCLYSCFKVSNSQHSQNGCGIVVELWKSKAFEIGNHLKQQRWTHHT